MWYVVIRPPYISFFKKEIIKLIPSVHWHQHSGLAVSLLHHICHSAPPGGGLCYLHYQQLGCTLWHQVHTFVLGKHKQMHHEFSVILHISFSIKYYVQMLIFIYLALIYMLALKHRRYSYPFWGEVWWPRSDLQWLPTSVLSCHWYLWQQQMLLVRSEEIRYD